MKPVPKRTVEVVPEVPDPAVREGIYSKDLSAKAVSITMIFCKIELLVTKIWVVSFKRY